MTPRAFPKCECAAGYVIDKDGTIVETPDGVRILPAHYEPGQNEGSVPLDEAFNLAATAHRFEYRIPKGAWEIAFEVDE